MTRFTIFFLLLCGGLFAAPAKPVAKKPPAKAAAGSSAKRPVGKTSAAARAITSKPARGKAIPTTAGKATSKTTRKGRYAKAKTASRRWVPGQYAPSSERYQEIQSALKERGYLTSEPTGEWGAESQNALRKFQRDQKIDGDGSINSLSLIALGLGPKRPEQTQSSLP